MYGTPSKPLTYPTSPAAANFGVNFPLLSYASIPNAGTPYETPTAYSVVEGSLISWPNTTFKVQAYLTDGSGDSQGEGKTFLGDVTVTTDDIGNASFSIRSAIDLAAGQNVTATVTELDATTQLPTNTSEFAANLAVGTKTKYYDNGTNPDGGHFVVNLTYSGIRSTGAMVLFHSD